MKKLLIICVFFLAACNEHQEHAGKATAGHAGEATAEHAGDGVKTPTVIKTTFDASDVKTAIRSYIEFKQQADGGVFKFYDPKEDYKMLSLKFVKIHDPVRKIEGRGYFACTDFSVAKDTEGKRYDIDFWLAPQNGKLAVTETHIHKEPQKIKAKWEKIARYTFVNDHPAVVN